jgi:hypothetical protein
VRGKAFRGLTLNGVAGATAHAVSIKGQVEPSMFTEPVYIPTVGNVSKALRWRRLSAIDGVDRFTEYRSVKLTRVPAQLQVLFRFGWPEAEKVRNGCDVIGKGAICHRKYEYRIIGSKSIRQPP